MHTESDVEEAHGMINSGAGKKCSGAFGKPQMGISTDYKSFNFTSRETTMGISTDYTIFKFH